MTKTSLLRMIYYILNFKYLFSVTLINIIPLLQKFQMGAFHLVSSENKIYSFASYVWWNMQHWIIPLKIPDHKLHCSKNVIFAQYQKQTKCLLISGFVCKKHHWMSSYEITSQCILECNCLFMTQIYSFESYFKFEWSSSIASRSDG